MTKQNEDSIDAMNIQDEKTRVPDLAELRSKSISKSKDMSHAIIAKFKEHGYVKIRAIGPAAIGKAYTAFTIARSKFILNDIEAISYGSFFDIKMENGEVKTGITLTIEDR